MSYMGANRRATVDKDHPEAFAICDRCGFLRNHKDLRWQYQYRGNTLTNTRFLVCYDTCLDVPHEFDRPLILPADPVPVQDPRPRQTAQMLGEAPADIPVQQIIEGE